MLQTENSSALSTHGYNTSFHVSMESYELISLDAKLIRSGLWIDSIHCLLKEITFLYDEEGYLD